MQKILNSPASFEQQQMIRLLHNYNWKTKQLRNITIHAYPFPDQSQSDVCQLRQSGQSIDLISRQDSLSSGMAVIPPYLQEILIKQYHDEVMDFHDFLNIMNNIFFHIDYRVQEYSALLTRTESDQRKQTSDSNNNTDLSSMMRVIPLICGSGVLERHGKWLQYSLLFGITSRSVPELTRILREYFSCHLSIQAQLMQQHLLPASEQSFLSSKLSNRTNANNAMKGGILLGKMVWLAHQALHITLFPESSERLNLLLKQDDWKYEMNEMVRFYLQDKTEVIIQTSAPQHWYARQPISASKNSKLQLGRGFDLVGKGKSGRPLITIHHRSKE